MNFRNLAAFGVVIGSSALAGCAMPGLCGGDHSRSQVRGEQTVRMCVVESVRRVRIDARDTGTGTLA